MHKNAVSVKLRTHQDIGELLSMEHRNNKAINRAYLCKVLQNIVFLTRQGLALRGNWVTSTSETSGSELNSNFHQLLLLHSKDDPNIIEIMKRKTHKYTDHHIHNEFINLIAMDHLRTVSKDITQYGYFALECDEVTDSSNCEQVIVCLRWVDPQFEPHEEFIGLHQVDDIKTATIVRVLKDTVLRMNLNLSMRRAQCYDGAANMKKAAKEIKSCEHRALYLHCYGHSLNLAVADAIKSVPTMSNVLDHAMEVCKLIKFSPRRDAIFHKLKDELTPQVPGPRNLCPTRWTVRASSLESIRLNYPALIMSTWDEAIDVVKESEVKGRIGGAASKMKQFDFLFGLMLAERILKHTDNLSKTLQATQRTAAEGHELAILCNKVLAAIRTEECFVLFWSLVKQTQSSLEISEPVLRRRRKRPRRIDDGTAEYSFPVSVEEHYRCIYFESLDTAKVAIENRFDQENFGVYAKLEQLLLHAANKVDYSNVLQEVVDFYQADFN